MKDRNKKIDCHKCKHFYVTWDKNFPHGCKAMGFKSKSIPSTAVYEASGISCQQYDPKNVGQM
jgi:hypothetical protein